jgi:membrane associated rhomboid family serine protease
MKLEQKLVLIYLAIGIVMGVLSNYLYEKMGLAVAVAVPLVIYAISIAAFLNIVKDRKVKSVVINSFVTFILFWLVIWIFLFNV